MQLTISTPLAVLGLLGVLLTACSSAAVAYLLYRRQSTAPCDAIERKRIEVYHDIMTSVIALNRRAVELDDADELVDDHERLVLNQESELDAHLDEVTERFHRSYYVIDSSVRDAVSEYVDYISSYHEAGVQVGRILSLSGNVVKAMREDLGLSDIFADVTDR